jgi:hypothetical protein
MAFTVIMGKIIVDASDMVTEASVGTDCPN